MTRGALTLVFDDGYQEVYEQVLPLLRRFGIKAVFAIPVETKVVEASEHATLASFDEWRRACATEGHELAAHGVTHRALTTLNEVELAQELRQSQEKTGATTLVYPGGAVDDRVRTAASQIFRAARTTRWGTEDLPPEDPFLLSTLNATGQNFHWWKFRPRELSMLLTGGWVIETFHRVTKHPRALHDVSLHDFEKHLQWLRRLSLRITTICDIVEKDKT